MAEDLQPSLSTTEGIRTARIFESSGYCVFICIVFYLLLAWELIVSRRVQMDEELFD